MVYDRIKELCRQRGISIAKVERDLNFSNGAIGKWKKVSPRFCSIVEVAKYFNVSLDYFVK